MATFAKIGAGNIVEQVVSVHNDVITDEDGKAPRADFNEFGRYITIKATNFTSVSEFVCDVESGGDS